MIVYKGGRRQRGYGIGGLFSSFFRKAQPFLKDSGLTVGKNVLGVASNVLQDVEQGRNVLDSIKKHGKRGALKTAKEVWLSAFKRGADVFGDIYTQDTKRRRSEEYEDDIFS